MTDATLSAKVTADIADFTKKFGEVRGTINDLASSTGAASGKAAANMSAAMGGSVKQFTEHLKLGASTAVGVATAVEGSFFAIAKAVSESTEKISQISQQTGIAASTLEQWQPILARTNTSVQSFATSYKALSKDIVAAQAGNKAAVLQFAELGLSIDNLGNTDSVIAALANRLASIEDPAQRAQLAVTFLGRSGLTLIPALAGGNQALLESAQQARDWGLALTDVQRGDLLRFDDALDNLGSSFQGLKTQIAISATPALQAIADMIQGAIGWFRKLDGGVQQVVTVFGTAFAAGGPVVLAAAGAAAALGIAFTPILVGGAVVVALIGAVTLILANWQKIKDVGTAIWTGAQTTIVGAARGIYQGLVEWLVNKPTAIIATVQGFAQQLAQPFERLADHLVGHSVIPDMVEDIGRHMELLDVAMSAPARNATANTGRIIEGAALTWTGAISQFISTVNFGWGSITQTVGASLAQMTTKTVDWAAVGIQIGQQFLGNMITLALQLLTQWVLTATGMTAAHTAMEAAKTTASATGEAARLAMATVTGKAISASMLGQLAAVSALATGMVSLMGAVIGAVVAMMGAIGSALIAGVITAPLAAPVISSAIGLAIAGGAAMTAGMAAIAGSAAGAASGILTSLAVPAFAKGGAVFGPTLAMVGEHATRGNPEFIGHANQLGLNQGGGTTTIIIQLDGRELTRQVMKHLPGLIYMKTGLA
jgi:hypothetical protein